MIYGGDYDVESDPYRLKRLSTREWGSVLSFQIYTPEYYIMAGTCKSSIWNPENHLNQTFMCSMWIFRGRKQAWTSSKHWCQESLDIAKMQPVAQVQCMDGDYVSLLEEMQQWSLEKLGVAQFFTSFEGLRNIWQLSHFCCSKICVDAVILALKDWLVF